jgi:flagellum-specific peptidoglycan hydrolase FlgJ
MKTSNEIKLIANRVYIAALKMGMSENFAKLITAQSRHESGNYNSSVFNTNNNSFGYKYFKGSIYQLKGQGKKSPEGNSYAAYANIEDSTFEVCAWLKRRWNIFKNVSTPEQYATALKKAGYYGDPISVYSKGVKKFYNEFVSGYKESSPYLLPITIVAIILLAKKN